MSVYFVSDLHIWGPEDPFYFALLAFIRDQLKSGDSLVLAGDIFDLFIGSKGIYQTRYEELLLSLNQAVQKGVDVHFIEGNHDFLMSCAWIRPSGIQLHSESVSIEIHGKRIFVAHGDTVDRSDFGYLFLRALLRSALVQGALWLIPGHWLDQFGVWSSRRSRSRNPLLVSQLPIERREALRKVYRSFAAERISQGYDFVVMGHCHDLDEMFFQLDGRVGQYVNMGFPRVHGSILSWTPGENKIHRQKLRML
jgi:UDP-2,3-diacylglucosamine hydrolase